MDQYNIRVTNTTKVALALVLIPMSIVPAILLIAVKLPNLPDWGIGTIIALMLVSAVLLTLYMVKRITPQAVLTLHNDGFSVDFAKKDLFTPNSFSIKINDVTNFFAEGKDGLYYLSFTTSLQPYKFNIEARSRDIDDLVSFTELMGKVAQMIVDNNEQAEENGNTQSATNLSSTQKPHTITSVSMYETWWAKVISIFAILVFVTILAMIAFAPDKAPDSWRLTTLVIFGVPFIYKVWYHNYRKNKKG